MFRGVPLRSLVLVGVISTALTSTGCKPNPKVTPASAVKISPTSTNAPTEIEDQLKSGLYQLQPENLGIDSRLEDAVSVLNNWWTAVKGANLEPTGLTPPAIPEALMPAAAREELERELYSNMDGLHIRNAYLAKQIGDNLTARSDKELDRIVTIFEWVCRNLDLIPEDETSPPLPFYELLMMGRGRTFDRAVVFSEILRQLHLDAVVLHPQGQLELDSPWVVGVPLDGKVYLFDPRLGFPLPRGEETQTARITQPAALDELLMHPEWLTPLAVRADQPYEPSVEQLQTAQVSVLASVMAWSPRMWRMEQLLPGDRLCVLYDPPAKLGDAPSQFDRIAASFPGKSEKEIGLFTDPMLRNPPDPTEQQAILRNMQTAQATLAVPFVSGREGAAAPGAGPLAPSQRQRKTRMLQLQGRYADALAQYVSIRQLGTTLPPEPSLGPIYARASEDAFYWSCLCKVDAGQFESAIPALTDYINRYRRGGRWLAGARQALADCHIARQQWAEAIETLKQSIPDDPARASTAAQIKRLSAMTTGKKE